MAPGASKRRAPWRRLLPVAATTELLYLLLYTVARREPSTSLVEKTPAFVALWLGLFVAYAYGVRAAGNAKGRPITGFVLLTSLLFRLSLLTMSSYPPPPRLTSPLEVLGGHLVTPLSASGQHILLVSPQRLLAAAAEIFVLLLMPTLLKAARLPEGLLVIYGWNPLVVKEGAGGTHLEALALAFLVLALRSLQKGSRRRAALAYGAALTGSPWAAACLPMMRRPLGAYAGVSLAVGAGAWSWALCEGIHPFPPGFTPSVGSSLSAVTVSLSRLLVTRNAAYPLALCALAWLLWASIRNAGRARPPDELPREALLSIGSFLMITPEAFPWHFLPLAGFAAFSRHRGWLVFTATAPLSYWAVQGGRWEGWSFWLGFAQYFPAYFSLIFGWLGGSAESRKR